ncbi:hypothetical protein [Nocardia sp. NPDC049707]
MNNLILLAAENTSDAMTWPEVIAFLSLVAFGAFIIWLMARG